MAGLAHGKDMGLQQAALAEASRRREAHRDAVGSRGLQGIELGATIDQARRRYWTLIVERIHRTPVHGNVGHDVSALHAALEALAVGAAASKVKFAEVAVAEGVGRHPSTSASGSVSAATSERSTGRARASFIRIRSSRPTTGTSMSPSRTCSARALSSS